MLKPIMLTEAEGNMFFKFYWFLIRNEKYKSIKNDSKILYCLFMDRVSLSIKNNWTNEEGQVYIIYTNEEVEKDLNMSRPTIVKCKKELTNCGLIREQRQGLNRPNLIYLFNDDFGNEEVKKNQKQHNDSNEPQQLGTEGVQNVSSKCNNTSIAKEKKKVNKKPSKDSNFEKLWALYPLKKGKNHIKQETKEEINNYYNLEELKNIMKEYLDDKQLEINGGFKRLKNGSTFFNGLLKKEKEIEKIKNTKIVEVEGMKVEEVNEVKKSKNILF